MQVRSQVHILTCQDLPCCIPLRLRSRKETLLCCRRRLKVALCKPFGLTFRIGHLRLYRAHRRFRSWLRLVLCIRVAIRCIHGFTLDVGLDQCRWRRELRRCVRVNLKSVYALWTLRKRNLLETYNAGRRQPTICSRALCRLPTLLFRLCLSSMASLSL